MTDRPTDRHINCTRIRIVPIRSFVCCCFHLIFRFKTINTHIFRSIECVLQSKCIVNYFQFARIQKHHNSLSKFPKCVIFWWILSFNCCRKMFTPSQCWAIEMQKSSLHPQNEPNFYVVRCVCGCGRRRYTIFNKSNCQSLCNPNAMRAFAYLKM